MFVLTGSRVVEVRKNGGVRSVEELLVIVMIIMLVVCNVHIETY